MPIDLVSISANWLAVLTAQRRGIAGLSATLERWLAERLSRLRELETRTRAFPVFAFDGMALSAVIDGQQRGALRPYRNAGQAWAAPFVAFGRGFTRIPQAVEDELVLPNLLGAIEGVFALIDGSIRRLIRPRPSSFDPRNARASDLFGLFGMAWRGLSTSTGQLRILAGDLGRAKTLFAGPSSGGGPAALDPATGAVAPMSTDLGETLGDVARWISGAILLLPVIPDWIATIARAAWLRARVWLLDTMQAVERRVFALRSEVLGFLLQGLPRMLREVPALVAAMGTMLQWSINYYAVVARIYFEVVVSALNVFLQGVHDQVTGFIAILDMVFDLIESVLDFDLLSLIKPFLGVTGMLIDLIGVRFTLNDLFDSGVLQTALYVQLKAAILAARGIVLSSGFNPIVNRLPWVGSRLAELRRSLLHDLGLIEAVVDALFGNSIELANVDAPVIDEMPNFYDLFFGAPPAEIAQHVRDFGGALAANVGSLFETVATTLRNFGEVFARTASELARTGPAARMAQFGRDSAGMANELYDDQIRALGERIRATPIGSFERWLAGNGFRIVEAAIPLYIGEMRRWWREQADSGDGPYLEIETEITPTSPHILARRARLARVRVPRLILRAPGRAHDESLVRELARSFQDAVGRAYANGERQLALIAGRV